MEKQTQAVGALHFIQAARCSMVGLQATFIREESFRQEIFLAAIFLPLSFFVGATWFQTLFLIALVLLVLIVELLNTGIEAVIDRIGTEHHELSGLAKDVGSAAVFLCLLLNAISWSVLIGQNILHWW